MAETKTPRAKWLVVGAGLMATAGLTLTTAVTMGAFNAAVVNPTNSFSSGSIVLQEKAGSTTCDSTGGTNSITVSNSANCTTIDDLGGAVNQVPGGSAVTQTLNLKNLGSTNAASFTLTPGTCSQAAASGSNGYSGSTADFCNDVDVTIEDVTNSGSPKCIYPTGSSACPALSSTYTLKTLSQSSALSLGALSANATNTYAVKVQLDSGIDNSDQGTTASMQFSWALAQ